MTEIVLSVMLRARVIERIQTFDLTGLVKDLTVVLEYERCFRSMNGAFEECSAIFLRRSEWELSSLLARSILRTGSGTSLSMKHLGHGKQGAHQLLFAGVFVDVY